MKTQSTIKKPTILLWVIFSIFLLSACGDEKPDVKPDDEKVAPTLTFDKLTKPFAVGAKFTVAELQARVKGEKNGYTLKEIKSVKPTGVIRISGDAPNYTITILKVGSFTATIILKHDSKPDATIKNCAFEITSSTAGGKFASLITKQQYETLFPKRYGFDLSGNPVSGKSDFYTYQSLIDAIDEMSDIKVEVYLRKNPNGSFVGYAKKIKWIKKSTKQEKINITHSDYNASWNKSKPEVKVSDLNFSDFCNGGGDLNSRKRELAAFFANISHETTGGGYSEKTKTTGLHWREELSYAGSSKIGYVSPGHATYPAVAGKSYHGRGPIQLSWNYNYGQASEYIYGDKNIFLSTPEKVLESGKIAFMTAIWFWMTPQHPKPSCHQVMVGKWTPTSSDIAAKRDQSKFGMTVNIINGGLECGTGNWDYRGKDRVEFYKRYLTFLGVPDDGDVCSCEMMRHF